MNQVTFHKHTLREILEKNLAKHIEDYDKSVDLYKVATKAYHEKLAEIAANDPMNLPRYDAPEKPEDYSRFYREAIEMLTYEINDTITLTVEDFKQLVKDEWSWKNRFFAADRKNTSYLS